MKNILLAAADKPRASFYTIDIIVEEIFFSCNNDNSIQQIRLDVFDTWKRGFCRSRTKHYRRLYLVLHLFSQAALIAFNTQ